MLQSSFFQPAELKERLKGAAAVAEEDKTCVAGEEGSEAEVEILEG